MFRAVKGKRGWLAIDERLQVDGPAPHELEVRQGVRRLIEFEIDPVVFVPQQEFTPVAIIAVYYINPRFAEVCQAKQQPLLDLLEFPGLNDVLAGLFLEGVGEQLVLDAELGCQEGVDKGDIVMD